MDNPEKQSTHGTQDEEKQKTHHNISYMVSTFDSLTKVDYTNEELSKLILNILSIGTYNFYKHFNINLPHRVIDRCVSSTPYRYSIYISTSF